MKEKKVLIIDDNTNFLLLLQFYGENKKYKLYFESSAEAGYQRAEEIIPDLILCDYVLGKVNGLEVCKRVRENPKIRNCIFIMMTNKPITKEIEEEFHNLPDGWVSKSLGAEQIFNKIDKWLEIKQE
ncbi:MAG TPA: response regulator [bacterium]|nr:response regulator [bacterium]HOL48343.1 response regulator [bacterium]HPQ19839.1 response regulator [bacterium]